jgi:hypothetical protein
MENHKHLFKNIGGGCFIKAQDIRQMCDDEYKCDCGAYFRLWTSLEGHTYLPKFIQGDKSDEIKHFELAEINRVLEEGGIPPIKPKTNEKN